MGKVEKTNVNLKKCKCSRCPTYTFMCNMKSVPRNVWVMRDKDISKLRHMEGLFCAFGKSKCLKKGAGCICSTCLVFKENKLDRSYYCLK